MAEWALYKTRIREGVWQGRLSGGLSAGDPPALEVTHLDRPVEGVSLAAEAEGAWTVRVPIPAELLSDGVQTFLIREKDSDRTLTSFCIVAGDPLDDDIRAELDLLRAELDMLKKAFRRHCLETM